MALTEEQKLVRDTLHYRDPHVDGTCFATNAPGLRLVGSGPSFLPAVEAALVQAASNQDQQSDTGLDYVIGAFLIIGTKYDKEKLVPFIRSVPKIFMKQIILNIPVFFRKTRDGYNFGVAPPHELI